MKNRGLNWIRVGKIELEESFGSNFFLFPLDDSTIPTVLVFFGRRRRQQYEKLLTQPGNRKRGSFFGIFPRHAKDDDHNGDQQDGRDGVPTTDLDASNGGVVGAAVVYAGFGADKGGEIRRIVIVAKGIDGSIGRVRQETVLAQNRGEWHGGGGVRVRDGRNIIAIRIRRRGVFTDSVVGNGIVVPKDGCR